ncbi:hypothetical protein F5888DRAFT_1020738 [Russula emetica]|nr:hypothetical protein F5888DRAFT_1020738 [Russula emetica]
MDIPDPPWKKRTRPCPFYSQGRCVFSESCGFLHDVKIKNSVDQDLEPTSSLDAESSRSSMGSIVKSPPAVAVHSSATSPSSARTPRMTSLLSALQGIIGPVSPLKAEFPAHEEDVPTSDASDASTLPHDAMQSTGPVHDGDLDNEPVQASQEDIANATSLAVDNDMSEDPQSNPISPPGLLSPVQIGPDSPFQLPRVTLDATLSREDSIDSGYAETWVGPTPFSLSPPQLNQPSSTLDLLSSPFGSTLSRVLPGRYSHPTRQTSSPASRDDSIDLVSPPVSTTAHQDTISSRTSLESIRMMYATESPQSSPHSTPSRQGEMEDANQVFGEPDLPMALSIASLAETLLFPVPPSEIPVLKHPAPLTSSEDVVEPRLATDDIPQKDSSSNQEEGALLAVVRTVETSPTLERFSAQSSHATEISPSSPTTMDAKMSSPHATGPLSSPISLKPTEEIGEPDYDALYQCLVMSPEEAAAKRMSWASRPSPSTLSRKAASASCSTSALVDIPERPHSAVDVLPWSRQWDLQVTPVSVSENNSRTSSPLLETPLSSSSSQAIPSVPSVYPAPSSAPPGKATSTLNDRSEVEPTRSKWSRVSTSRRVPFGFRHSMVVCFLFSNSTDLCKLTFA